MFPLADGVVLIDPEYLKERKGEKCSPLTFLKMNILAVINSFLTKSDDFWLDLSRGPVEQR